MCNNIWLGHDDVLGDFVQYHWQVEQTANKHCLGGRLERLQNFLHIVREMRTAKGLAGQAQDALGFGFQNLVHRGDIIGLYHFAG